MGASKNCIYRVPNAMRVANHRAYTPQMVMIGPLHLSIKEKQKDSNDTAETSKKLGHLKKKKGKKYMTMEDRKEDYRKYFFSVVGEGNIEKMKATIHEEYENIRESYEEKTIIDFRTREFFVDLVLNDSIFIMVFMIKLRERRHGILLDDVIVDNPKKTAKVKADLMMLENQLPYFIFDKLFSIQLRKFSIDDTLNQLFLELFSLDTKVTRNTEFKHFTHMFVCAYEESLDQFSTTNDMNGPAITEMQNANNLSRVGVKFKVFSTSQQDGIPRQSFTPQQPLDLFSLPIFFRKEDEYSLNMAFTKGCLVMSKFTADETSERVLRNVIAYEQCHADTRPLTYNYIQFINFLVTSERDVEILTAEGVLMNGMGRPSLVVEMVNKLKTGVDVSPSDTSQYHNIAMNLKAHYKSRRKRCWATLNRVYFTDLWTGTATIAAVLLLFLTLVGTVASVIQAYKSFDKIEAKN